MTNISLEAFYALNEKAEAVRERAPIIELIAEQAAAAVVLPRALRGA